MGAGTSEGESQDIEPLPSMCQKNNWKQRNIHNILQQNIKIIKKTVALFCEQTMPIE
jgi:hypothetical protein